MNGDIVNKWAIGLAVFSFGFLSIGSFLFGATVTTSVLRGLGGGVFFAALLWLVGLLVNEEEDPTDGDDIEEGSETVLSAPVVTDSDAVRDKFLNKSREISEKAEEEKKKEKEKQEAKEAKEATPF